MRLLLWRWNRMAALYHPWWAQWVYCGPHRHSTDSLVHPSSSYGLTAPGPAFAASHCWRAGVWSWELPWSYSDIPQGDVRSKKHAASAGLTWDAWSGDSFHGTRLRTHPAALIMTWQRVYQICKCCFQHTPPDLQLMWEFHSTSLQRSHSLALVMQCLYIKQDIEKFKVAWRDYIHWDTIVKSRSGLSKMMAPSPALLKGLVQLSDPHLAIGRSGCACLEGGTVVEILFLKQIKSFCWCALLWFCFSHIFKF